MKKLSTALGLLALLYFAACKKTPIGPSTPFFSNLSQIKAQLKDSLSSPSFDSLDYSRVVIATRDTGRTYYVRIPFTGISVLQRFVLVRTNATFTPAASCILNIERSSMTADSTSYGPSFSGTARKTWLSGSLVFNSPVHQGYVLAFHPLKTLTPTMEQADDPYVELPEIIIYGDDPDDYYADWDLFLPDNSGGGGGGSAGYSSAAPAGGGGGAANAASFNVNNYSFDVTNELQASKPAINLKAYFNCFATITDPNATYTAALCVRIPNPGNPNVMWNPITGNVGHTFVMLSKTGGGQTITQYIGFYAACSFCAISGHFTPSKIVDNAGHPYDATLTVNLSASDFSDLLSSLQTNSELDYALGLYNCTNFAVDAFNQELNIIGTELNVPDMAIPSQDPGMTPNGLYKALEALPADGPDGKVTLYPQDQTAGDSHGPCN